MLRVGGSANGFISQHSSVADYGSYSTINRSTNSGDIHGNNSCSSIPIRRGIILPFFRKPKLKIVSIRTDENKDFRWRTWQQRNRAHQDIGEIMLPYEFYPLRRFINVTVENEGKEPARNCEIGLRPLQKDKGCKWLSNDEKSLTWNDGNTLTSIRARGGKAVFHLAFSQESFSPDRAKSIDKAYCGVVDSDVGVVSWIGSQDALVNPDNRSQDGLCQGTFKVHVDVAAESGHSVSAHFNIKVGGTWKDLNVDSEKVDKCDCDK
jgi:hypothetical protein